MTRQARQSLNVNANGMVQRDSLKRITSQGLFDKAVYGVMKQGRPARAEYGCMYVTPEGNKCAVGQILPDLVGENLVGSVRDGDVQEVIAKVIRRPLTEKEVDMLVELQVAHDSYSVITNQDSYNKWRHNFVEGVRKTATKHGLSFPPGNSAAKIRDFLNLEYKDVFKDAQQAA